MTDESIFQDKTSQDFDKPEFFLVLLMSAFAAISPLYLLWHALPLTDDMRFAAFTSVIGVLIAGAGAVVAIVSYRRNAIQSALQARRQHTIHFLLEARLSGEF